MNLNSFNLSSLPQILFGPGRIGEVPALAAQWGERVLLVTGARSFRDSIHWAGFTRTLAELGMTWEHMTVSGEPSPDIIDEAVQRYRPCAIDVVIGIGGGSVLDAAKAIAGLLPHGNSVLDHLEGVGKGIPYTGPSTPYIAVPTTAGTGSEATKNAVLSTSGDRGYKKSFRHDCLVPRYAVVDPDLLASCPADVVAADGMDAFTQLLESYVSLKANPFIDALAWSGMQAVKEGLFDAWRGREPAATQGRRAMAYAALLSGICLAQVGLGSVHGVASPLGAYFPIPHGVVCGTMVAAATRLNIQAMAEREPDNPALAKYAQVGRLLSATAHCPDATAHTLLVETLERWTEQLGLARLGHYGITEAALPKIVANSRGSSMTTNPITLADDEIMTILKQRL